MYAIRCVAATLSILAIVYILLSALVALGWRLAVRFFPQPSSVSSARFLYMIRVAPLLGAILAALWFELPSFLYFEPKGLEEQVGTWPLALSALCLLFAGSVAWQVVSVCRRTSDLCRHWTGGLPAVRERQGLPVFTTNTSAPPMAVAGIREPRLLLSPALLQALEQSELDRSLAHEAAHVRHWDNLRKLGLLLCRFPGMSPLERRWADATEFAADESAVGSKREALELASALVKISGMSFAAAQPEALVTNFVGSSASTERRIQLLMSWEKNPGTPRGSQWIRAAALAAAAIALLLNYTLILATLHSFTEALFR
jgi:Zn-dependent protease with chaperone function